MCKIQSGLNLILKVQSDLNRIVQDLIRSEPDCVGDYGCGGYPLVFGPADEQGPAEGALTVPESGLDIGYI